MSRSGSPIWDVKPAIRLDRRDPYLLLQHVTVFVQDQDRSLRFYVDCLGFSGVLDHRFPDGGRFIAVAPPDGTARLALVTPQPDSEEYACIGKSRQVVFLTEDVEGKYRQWSDRGISFLHPPKEPAWGGVYTQFRDVDGNSFALMGFDQANREVEEQRRLTEERLESERRAAQELEIARQVQSRLFP